MDNLQADVVVIPQSKGTAVVNTSEFAGWLDTNLFNQMWRGAQALSRSDFLPTAFKGKVENCFVGLQMAVRLSIDPMLLMQHMYIVHGRPGIEAKLAIALVNQRGPFTGPLEWRFEGTGKTLKCTCYATHKVTGRVCEQSITYTMVEAEGWLKPKGKPDGFQMPSKWVTMPEIMFQYRAAMFLARLHCPEVLMGMKTTDELEDIPVENQVSGERIEDTQPTRRGVEGVKSRIRQHLSTKARIMGAPSLNPDLHHVAVPGVDSELVPVPVDDISRARSNFDAALELEDFDRAADAMKNLPAEEQTVASEALKKALQTLGGNNELPRT